MKKKANVILFAIIIFLFTSPLGRAEHLSIKLSFNSNSIGDGDINSWINSYNTLWNDWKEITGGEIEGKFIPLSYGPSYEVELRVPLFEGLAINMGVCNSFADIQEGSISFQNPDNTQTESQFIKNKVSAFPLKIGFSYAYALPFFPRTKIFASIGRHLVFIQYQSWNNYDYSKSSFGKEYSYWYRKENKYSSEALGFYTSFGAEFDIIKNIAVVLEAEKTWSKADGFKGSNSYTGFLGQDEFQQSGKATLYYYSSDPLDLGKNYFLLAGHIERPDDPSIIDIRQGEIDFSNFSIKFGIRFKF
jgi:hypothetical protein